MMIGIVGGVCFAAGVLAHYIITDVQKTAAEREQKQRERQARGGLTDRQYQIRYNDVLRENMQQYGN